MKIVSLSEFIKNISNYSYISDSQELAKIKEYSVFISTDFKIDWFLGKKPIFQNLKIVHETNISKFYAINGEQIFNIDKEDKSRIYWHYNNLNEMLDSGCKVHVVDNFDDLI